MLNPFLQGLMTVCLAASFHNHGMSVPTAAPSPTQQLPTTVTYQVVTNEISAKQTSGPNVNVYRFDPSTFVATQGDDVVLQIRGLKGHNHPIVLEGYGVSGVVQRNQVTTLRVKANKAGVFRLICTSHADAAHEGPMEAYFIVLPKPN